MGICRKSQERQRVMLVSFMGAITDIDDDGRIIDYVPRGKVMINPERVSAAYDHTILTDGDKIRVMETMEEIQRKLTGRQ